ncbi:DUF4215 domain-containing protein [Nannocystis sp. SCPEA4]|uniref:DUF4215 domain-containing protein n=1 Tax=Nannocystis sp. SCPEA4 TaxID=2996787 RepID=UPI002271C063|nr:DUF4215 domain-containing protein [Nannocystis sp. SCPEA4]MCY1059088.1 hypothetical protein [Nannocystis sp. SCPEA4]
MLASGRVAFWAVALTAVSLGPSGCADIQGQCLTAACWAPADTSTSTTTATDTTTDTTESTTGPALCGNAVIDPGETCDDGQDCGAGVCNSDEYTGEKHCSATCDDYYPNWCGDKAMQSQESCDEGGNTPTCDDDCTPVECGDGLFNAPAGETCDDGEDNSDAYDDTPDQVACNTSCTGSAPHCGDGVCQEQVEDTTCADCTCGDGITSPSEPCDAGMNGTPTDSETCDADCTPVECGDGHHNPAAGEGCDDGNQIDDDECNNNCTTCGDGTPQPGEECDDGNDVDDDACSNACIKPRLVFVTSAQFLGNLGGLAGADMKCAAAGMTANPNLPATAWRAWLSDDTGSPSTRFDTTFTGWYQLVNGTPIAKGWSDLTDGNLAAPINLTESAAAPAEPPLAWSNTTGGGMNAGSDHCNNWKSAGFDPVGRFGNITATNTDWTDVSDADKNPDNCSNGLHLYCFQNAP